MTLPGHPLCDATGACVALPAGNETGYRDGTSSSKTGAPIRSLATDLPAGFTFGPDGKIYLTDKVGGRVLRIDPQ